MRLTEEQVRGISPDGKVPEAKPKEVPFSKLPPAQKFERKWRELDVDGSEPETEYVFHDERNWRLDYAWPKFKVAVEIDGFGFGHQAQQRIAQNNEKRNQAVLLGWRVFAFDSRSIGSHERCQEAADMVLEAIIQADQQLT